MSQTVYVRYRGRWVPATILPDGRRVIPTLCRTET